MSTQLVVPRSDMSIQSDCVFKPIEPWDRLSASNAPIQIMKSNKNSIGTPAVPFGIESPVDESLNVCTEDIFNHMVKQQSDFVSPETFNPEATYIPYRRYLVDWMSDVGEQCRLHNTTVHVSILFLDKIFRDREIPRCEWQLLATACISIASKYEEAEEHCPPIPNLLQLTKLYQTGINSLSFREGELEVMKYLGWRLRVVPPLHIIGYYVAKGTTYTDDTWQGHEIIEKIPKYIKKYAEFFCNLTLQEYTFQQYLPSHLAAAILLASRVALQVYPRWRSELVRLTGYEECDIIGVFNHVWSYYEEQFPGHGSRSISPRNVTSAAIVGPYS